MALTKSKKKNKSKKQVYVFIDTNIYLEYFNMSSATVTSLEELLKLLRKGDFKLILPKQVEDEYWRGKEKIIQENKEAVQKQIPRKPQLPASVKDLTEAKKIRENYYKFKTSFDKLITKYDALFKKKIKAEKLIEDIFKIAISFDEDKNIIEKGYHRYLKGNPPGKKNSYGDAIIWETLLAKFTDGKLFIITEDQDWYVDKDREFLNELLVREWQEKAGRKLKTYSSLSEFINEFTGRRTIKKEIVEEEKAEKEYSHSTDMLRISGNSFLNVANSIERYHCPFCNKDITIELENQFPYLKDLNHPFTAINIMPEFAVVSPLYNEAECPYCHKHFNLNNIVSRI